MNRMGLPMNKEDPYRDQAERLRQRVVLQKEDQSNHIKDQLPSRSEAHKQKHRKKKTKIKIKYPLIRLLVLFFILLPITIFSVYTYLDNQNNGKTKTASVDNSKFETVDIESDSVEEDEISPSDDTNFNSESDEDELDLIEPSIPTNTNQQAGDDKNSASSQETEETSNGKVVKEETKKEDNREVEKEKNVTIVYHKVQKKDTLFSIAMKYYQSQSGIEKIKAANHIQGEEIQVGQVLQIPISK